jgi:predicted phage tail component-like protein
MIEISFNNKKSYTNFDITIVEIIIESPSKKKIKESVPFMNSSYDFSTVATNGESVYTERKIKVKFNLKANSKTALYNKHSQVLAWLLDTGQSELTINDLTDCYFLAEVENAPSFDTVVKKAGIMDIEFIAEPFKIGKDYIGQEVWDNINFETDVLQDTSFNVSGSKTVSIYNPGRLVATEVIVDSNMSCTLNGYTANFTTSKSKDYKFKLQNGYNNITINGTGNIEFRFRKQVL